MLFPSPESLYFNVISLSWLCYQQGAGCGSLQPGAAQTCTFPLEGLTKASLLCCLSDSVGLPEWEDTIDPK